MFEVLNNSRQESRLGFPAEIGHGVDKVDYEIGEVRKDKSELTLNQLKEILMDPGTGDNYKFLVAENNAFLFIKSHEKGPKIQFVNKNRPGPISFITDKTSGRESVLNLVDPETQNAHRQVNSRVKALADLIQTLPLESRSDLEVLVNIVSQGDISKELDSILDPKNVLNKSDFENDPDRLNAYFHAMLFQAQQELIARENRYLSKLGKVISRWFPPKREIKIKNPEIPPQTELLSGKEVIVTKFISYLAPKLDTHIENVEPDQLIQNLDTLTKFLEEMDRIYFNVEHSPDGMVEKQTDFHNMSLITDVQIYLNSVFVENRIDLPKSKSKLSPQEIFAQYIIGQSLEVLASRKRELQNQINTNSAVA